MSTKEPKRRFLQIFAPNKKKRSIWEMLSQKTADFCRKSQKTAGTPRRPQIGVCLLRFVPLRAALSSCPFLSILSTLISTLRTTRWSGWGCTTSALGSSEKSSIGSRLCQQFRRRSALNLESVSACFWLSLRGQQRGYSEEKHIENNPYSSERVISFYMVAEPPQRQLGDDIGFSEAASGCCFWHRHIWLRSSNRGLFCPEIRAFTGFGGEISSTVSKDLSPLSFHSLLFFCFTKEKPQIYQGFSLTAEPTKILGKDRENTKTTKEIPLLKINQGNPKNQGMEGLKSLATVKYYSDTKWPLTAVKGR